MAFPVHPEDVKRFVQNTLGCSCPDSVFDFQDLINDKSNYDIKKLVIGEKLLIYLLDIDLVTDWPALMYTLILAGKNERNSRGLNRFRLVLGAENPEVVEAEAARIFKGIQSRDDKTHLHIVSSMELEKID